MTNEENLEVEVRKKEQTFRGKTLEELKALDVREFANLLSSNRKRNVWLFENGFNSAGTSREYR